MSYEYLYDGSDSSLSPKKYNDLFTGHRIPAGELGATTSIQTANQVKEVTNLLNQGMKVVEVSTISPDVFEMIPKQHMKEINRLSKLTGSETSLHAPVIDPSGFTQQGWDETNRETTEKQFMEVVERAHELNPTGNIPVTIHSSQIPGTEHIEVKDSETGKMVEQTQKMIAVNRDNGQLIPLIREKRYYPGKGEKLYIPEEEIKIANSSYWDNKLSQLVFYKERGDEIMTKFLPLIRGEVKDLDIEQQKAARSYVENASIYYKNTHQTINSLFNEAYKFADDKGKEELKNASQQFAAEIHKAEVLGQKGDTPGYLSYTSGALQGLINNMQVITEKHTPQIYKPVEAFVKEKASETLGNVAFNAYKKFGDTAPIVSIENPPYGSAVSRAQDLKELIQESRKKFIDKAVKEGMDADQAKKAAENIIGATWDTSHISMMRKQGFKPEKLIEEAKIIAPFVKHVHYNDNFGSTHTDLPPGMGNVPMKEVMQQLEKAGFKGKKVFEGGNFFQHFQQSPHPYVLEGAGSSVYAMKMAPYWNQTFSNIGPYFAGYGTIFPEQHFQTYGGGFSGLPTELGGQVQARGSRATGGTPMA